jgi:hypothetical protein
VNGTCRHGPWLPHATWCVECRGDVVEARALLVIAVDAFESVNRERERLEEQVLRSLDRLSALRDLERCAGECAIEAGRNYARARDHEDWEARIEFSDDDAHVHAFRQDEIDRVRRWQKRSG